MNRTSLLELPKLSWTSERRKNLCFGIQIFFGTNRGKSFGIPINGAETANGKGPAQPRPRASEAPQQLPAQPWGGSKQNVIGIRWGMAVRTGPAPFKHPL